MSESTQSKAALINTLLTRVVTPLWVLAGALFKLYERNPQNLPVVIREIGWKKLNAALHGLGSDWNIDLIVLLRLLIGLELFAVLVMFLIPRLSRAMAVFMLTGFCIILIGEMAMKATSCGCFGSLPMKPWHMLVIDGSLLTAVLVTWGLRRSAQKGSAQSAAHSRSMLPSAAAMVPLLAVGLGIGFAVPEPAPLVEPPVVVTHSEPPTTQIITPTEGESQPAQSTQPVVDPQTNPNPLPVPSSWYIKTTAADWVGKSWHDIDLFQLMRRWPKDLDHGKHYVVFYSRTCEHCENMFWNQLLNPLDAPLSAVEIPSSKTVMTGEGAWQMPDTPHELLELPLGANWIITPPLAFTIVDGKVTCAVEGEGYENCLGLPPSGH